MKQGRTPDRVHVVHPPQDDFRAENGHSLTGIPLPKPPAAPQTNSRAMEIIRTLAQISDKLKKSESERYELLAELRAYRKTIHDLEDKADQSEKAYLTLENKLNSKFQEEGDLLQRQARFERALKEAENKIVQASAGQTLLDQRLKSAEEFQVTVESKIEATVTEQARLDRQVEKIAQDKSRMLRKVERMEEILTETQDTLKARALVLLTDQSNASQGLPQLSAMGADGASADLPWWRKSVRMQNIGIASMVVAALLFGWTINQIQQPEMPKIAVLQNGGIAQLDMNKKRWEIVAADQTADNADASKADATLTPVAAESEEGAPNPVAQSSDEDLLKALDENPDALAAQLNDISPEAQKELNSVIPPAPKAVETPVQTKTSVTGSLGKDAFTQDPQVANLVKREVPAGALSARVERDSALPAAVQKLETQALNGNAEAQHDLAAIYTAGRGGVTQSFEKAAFWFRESANHGVANAAYNLGVLYHQGLGVEKDMDRAIYWYREAAKNGHPEAQYNLGIAHIEGIGTIYNPAMAASFFESAANKGVVEAAYNLGLIYENGLIGGKSKPEDAFLWYKIAANHGSTDAKAALTQLTSSMGLDDAGESRLYQKMQSNYKSAHGYAAGAGIKG